jgi:replicative DNA helicase
MWEAMDSVLDEIEALGNRSPGELGSNSLSTGLEALDELTYGFAFGELVLVTAPVSVGKSTLALGTIRSTCIKAALPSLMLSHDMSRSEVIFRILSAEAKVPLNHIRNGLLTEDDWTRFARRMGEISSSPLYVQDIVGVNVEQQIIRAKRAWDIKLALVDPLDMAAGGPDPAAILAMTRDLKMLARSLNIVILATLPDVPEYRSDGRPAGLVDRYSDIVVHVDRDDVRNLESFRPGEADLSLTKARRGPVGMVRTVAFQGHYSRFVDMAV